MRKHNKGFTLIELVVTIAIIAVFSGVVAAVIGLGNNAYQSTSGNARVQMEAQEALDQIENLVIDANRSVYYANCSIGEGYGDLSLGAEITDDIEGADNGSKAFFICNTSDNGDGTARFLYDVLIWDAEGKKLIYTMKEYTGEADSGSGADAQSDFSFEEEPKDAEESGIEAFTSGEEDFAAEPGVSALAEEGSVVIEPAVLAQDITGFGADTTLVEKNRVVRFRLSAEKKGKKSTPCIL